MPRFFVPAGAVGEGRAVVEGDDAAHLVRSLRAAVGERIVVVDGSGLEHGVVIDELSAQRATGNVEWSRPATGEPRLALHLIQALPKDGMDELIDALTQVGVAAIHPVVTRHTVVRPDARRAALRAERWRAIARQAAGLAGRARIPDVHAVATLEEAVAALPPRTRLLACTVGAPAALAGVRPDTAAPLALCIGPEGDFSADELATLTTAGTELVHLGARVLRARLAGVVAAGVVLAASGDMDIPTAAPPAATRAAAATAP